MFFRFTYYSTESFISLCCEPRVAVSRTPPDTPPLPTPEEPGSSVETNTREAVWAYMGEFDLPPDDMPEDVTCTFAKFLP